MTTPCGQERIIGEMSANQNHILNALDAMSDTQNRLASAIEKLADVGVRMDHFEEHIEESKDVRKEIQHLRRISDIHNWRWSIVLGKSGLILLGIILLGFVLDVVCHYEKIIHIKSVFIG